MDEGLSIGTDTAGISDIASIPASDADENVVIDVKHLTVDPENVTRFREQLHSESQSKETGNASTAEGKTKRDASEDPVSKRQLPNERTLFGNNDRHTPPFVAGKSLYPSQNQSTDGSRKDFCEKSMKFDINSQGATLKTAGGAVTDNITHEEYVAHKSPFFEAPDPSKISVNNTKDFRETFINTETLPTDTPLRNTADGHKTTFHESVSQSHSDLPQPSPTLKSPATLLRELQNPTASAEVRTSGISSAKTLHTPENHTASHSTTTPIFNTTPSLRDTFAKDGTVALGTSVQSFDGNDTISTKAPVAKPSETQTREHPRSFETPSEPHKTAVIDTIPFLRTPNETITPVQNPTVPQTPKSHAALIAQQIRDHVIDRILVSSSALNDNRTVTVQLSPRLLRDTEVQFTQNGTSLDVRLLSQNKDSVQFLQQHQSDLQTYLQGELKTYRAISVRVPSSQASAELAQPHDGRSRNRFDYQTDEEETT